MTFTLPISQGATLRFTFTVSTNAGLTDLTGATARLVIREHPGADILAHASTEDGGLVLGGTAGTVAVYLTDRQTQAINVRRARYAIDLTYPSGDVTRVLEGPVSCALSVVDYA